MSRRRRTSDTIKEQNIRESMASVDTVVPMHEPPVKPPRRKSKQPPAHAHAPAPAPELVPEKIPPEKLAPPVRPPRPKRESKLLEQQQQQKQPPPRPPPPHIPPPRKVKQEPEPPKKPRRHDFDAGQRDADLIHLGNESRRMRCPACGESVMTKTDWEPSLRTHTMAFLLCMFLLWPCVCLPYCIPACNDIDHFCPLCGEYLGPA